MWKADETLISGDIFRRSRERQQTPTSYVFAGISHLTQNALTFCHGR